MPFTSVREAPRKGASGRPVYRVHIHPAHRPGSWRTAKNSDVSLALEEFDSELLTSGSWEEQSDAALRIRRDNHPHIVQTFACISIGQRKLILREWADGGSLDEYWQRSSPERSPQFVRNIIEQLHGLVAAMDSLPSEIWQHVRDLNLSPQTILRFQNGSGLGKLKLASFGQLSVGRQDSVTMLKYNGDLWPQEILWGYAISSSTWCIMFVLEFMVWFLYGWEELQGFRTLLSGDADLKDGYIPAFHHINPFNERPNAEVHSLVMAWIDHMVMDSECVGNTALGNLLWFLRDKVNDLSYTITLPNISSLAQGGPSVPKEKKGLGKILSRAKTVFMRDDGSSKRMSTQSTASHQPPTQTVTPSQSTAPATMQPPAAAAAVAIKETPKQTSQNEATQSKYEDSLFALGSTLSLQSIQYHLEAILGSGERNSSYFFTGRDRKEVLGYRTSLQRNFHRRLPAKQLSAFAQYIALSRREVDVASVDAFMERFEFGFLRRSRNLRQRIEAWPAVSHNLGKIKIAVIDSGVDPDDQLIQRAIEDSRIVDRCSWVDLTDPSRDTDDYGTRSTRILLQMAPAAEFYIAKIMHGQTIRQEDLWRVAEVGDL
ncbi:putative serine/threonine-protein kinase [Colletotrichum shisoi]|uniref:Putative serine/threonine-protein kinase n=1 Tax=Colletotrichum shisoi TaxID=2078593 RepID=A0A5Q4BCR3_9PEZI|nr:putative serine/threonine-protein kinase [Colletotrichum shisoi]